MALQNKICVGCNKQFEGRPNAKACSSKCRKRFFRARQAVKQEVEKLAQLRDEIKQDIHGSLSLPQLAPAVVDEAAEDSEPENLVDGQTPLLDDLNSSQAAIAPVEPQVAPLVSQSPVQPSVQTSFQPVEEPIYSQPPITSLESKPPTPDQWEQLQNSWQSPPAAPEPAQTAQIQAPAPVTGPVQTSSLPESPVAETPPLLENVSYQAPALENTPSSPMVVPEMPVKSGGPILTNWFKNKPLSVTLAFVVFISLASGAFAIFGLLRQSPQNQTGLSLQQDTTDDSLLNVKDAKLTLNIDTTVAAKLGVGTTPTGDASLQVVGDIQSSSTIFASGGGSSLSNAGLTINNVIVCTAAGCTTAAGATVALQNAVLGNQQIGNIYISGTVTAGNFSGSGTGLTGVNAAKLEGNAASFFTNASNLSSGTVADARLSSNVSLLGQTIDSGEILDGTIANIDIAAGAAIAYTKLNLTASITNTDIATGAAIAYSKLNLAGSVVSADVTDGTLVNADINAAAAIDWTKVSKTGSSLADLTTRSASDLTSGTLAIARGGTGAGTAQAAIDNLSGLTTTGDILYYDGANSTRLARGANGNCLQSSAVTIAWVACAGLINLQNAYDNGNTITTSDARNISLTLADTTTDANLLISTATGSTGFTTFSRADGAGAADPAQLLLIDNLDIDRAQPIGLKLQSAAGGLTTALDATDAEIVTALAIGSNTITTTTTTIAATELDLLDGHDVALVDTNDAVATAIVGSGALSAGSIAAGFGTIATANTITGTTLNGTTGINSGAGAGTQRIDLSGNLVNIGNLTATGAITIASAGAGNDVIINGADILDIQDATTFATTATFNGLSTFNTDVDLTLAGTENIAVTSDLAGTLNVVSLVATPSASVGTTRGFFIQQADSINGNSLDQALYIDNADTNLAIPAAISIQNSGGGGYTTLIDNAGTLISGAELNLLDAHDVALVDTNDAVATAITGTGTLTAGALGAGFTTVAVGRGGTGATTFTANGVLYGNTTAAVGVTAAGTTNQCLIATTGAAPSWGSCAGAGSGVTLQAAYDNGNTITTSDARNITLTLADTTTDANLLISTATGSTGFTTFSRADGAGAADPAQLLLIDNLDIDRAQPIGLKLQSAAGGLTTALDATDAEIVTALAIGSNTITTTTTTIAATELDLLDGHDVALVDTNDAVATAIIGTGALNAGSITSGFGTIDNADTITGTTLNGTTGINTGAGAGTNRIDVSGNLVNIGNLTATGAITIASAGAGNDIIINGADILDIQDATTFATTATFNGLATFNTDVDLVLAGTENVALTSDLAGTVNVVSLVATPSATIGTTRGFFIQQADSINGNGLDQALYIDNADTNLAIPAAISVQNSGGGGYTTIIDNAGTLISGAELNLLDGHDVALVDTNDAVATAITGTGALAAGSLAAGFTTVAVGQGGTGATTFTANGVLYGNTTAALGVTAAGTTNQCLIATTGAAPSWGSCAGATTTLQNAYDNDADGSDSIIALTTADDSLIFRNPAAGGTDSGYVLTLDQLATTATGGLSIQSAGTGNLLLITDTTATARDVMTIANGGATTFRNQTNSATAFQIQNAAGTSLLTADTSNLLVTVGGDLKIGQSTDVWSKASQATAGTIASGGTAGIDRVHAMAAVYNGSLYVGTDIANAAEVYRYDGGTTWTKVSQTTAGTIASGGTASIDGVNTMTVYNGSFYVGTLETGAAEVYRYDGGTTWTKVSQTTAGTIASGGTTLIDRVHGMTVYNGSLYINTQKTGAAEVYRYDGGTTWTKVSQTTAGTIASGGTASINSAHTAAVHNNRLYIGTQKTGAAEVYRYDGGTTWTKVSQTTAGTIASGGTALIDQIHGMAVHDGNLYVGTEKANEAEVYRYDGGTTWTKVSQTTAGTIASGGTTGIDGVNTMATYNGSLYLGTLETSAAEVYRYDGGTTWTKISQTTAGTIMSGGTTLVSGVQATAVYNGKLYFGTFKTGAAEVYGYSTVATLSTNGSNGLNVEINGTSVASSSKAGAILFQNSTNSTTAFQIQNAAAGQLFNVDTTNTVITLNNANSAALQAWQTNSSSGFTAYGELATTVANGYIYRIGGSSNGTATTTSVVYAKINADGSIGTWNAASALPVALSDQGAVAVNGYLYAVGGWNGTVVVDSVYYAKINPDGTLGTWTATSSLTAARGQPGVVAAGGYVYAIGGYNSAAQSTVYYAKVNANGTLATWATTSALSVARAFGGVAVANGYVYYMGGDDNLGAASNVVQYSQISAADGTLAAWATTSTLPSAATRLPAATLNGYLYTIGGKISSNPSSTISYAKLNADGTAGIWANDTNALPVAILFSGAATHNGYLYSLGGYTNAAGTTPTSAVYYASASRIKVAGSLDLVGISGQTLADSGSAGTLTAGDTSIVGSLQVRNQARLANGLSVLGASSFGEALFQNAANSATAFQIQNAAGSTVLGIDTLNGGLITHTPAATLLSGQSAFTQTISTNGPGTIDSFVQNVTVGATASISRGMHITVTDNNTAGSVNAGLLVSMEGTNTNQSQVGVEGNANRGVGVSGISTGASLGNNSCSQITISIGVCGSSSAGTGVVGRSSAAGVTVTDTLGNGTSGVNNAVATVGNFYKGLRGVTTTNANAAYTSIGVVGQAKGGTGSTTYGGYFTLDSTSTGTGAAIYGSNSTIATNILQLQDNTTDVFTVADGGALTAKNSTDSTTAFQIQNAAGASNLLIADTTNTILKVATTGSPTQAGTELFIGGDGEFSGALRIGDATNYAQFDGTTRELTLNGNARHTRRILLAPEYAGATMTADGASNTGTMTSDNMTSTPYRNFYKWVTTQGTAQDYDIWVKVPLPADFSALPTNQTICMDVYASATTANTIALTLYGTNNTAVTLTDGDLTPSVGATWQEQCTSSITGGTYAANGTITLDIKLTAPATTGDVRISSFYFDYLSKW